ncbi:MAG: hypothetical protein FJY73_03910 [Candidatus Eisenbacteria bacterium]|nr:hypothetical protein [Candidatus Eisenbacteria bacterium]
MNVQALLGAICALLMVSCATMPTQQEIDSLDYGRPLTIDYQTAIRTYFERVLFDPYSAHYEFGSPQRMWVKEPPLLGGRLYAGYMVAVGVNAKNRFGGYVGMQEYGFLFKNDEVVKILQPEEMRLLKRR